MSRTTGAVPVVADDRDQTLARISAMASAMPDRGRRIELVEGAEHRRVRRHRAEQVGLEAQVLDVRTALATTGQHQGGVHEDLPPVVDGEPLTGQRDPGRE